jgi:putative tryptophan/tyrosine transport system substrate-binding protein
MRRREFIGLIGVFPTVLPLAVQAQQKHPNVGILIPADVEPLRTELLFGMRQYGYIENQNVQFEIRSADGNPNSLRGLADDLVHLSVDVIVASLTPAVIAARDATSDIPIVMAWAGDPVGLGLISSIAHPGGNITGLSDAGAAIAGKSLELIHELLPATRQVAILANPSDPFSRLFIGSIENVGHALGIGTQTVMISRAEDFGPAFAAIDNERISAAILQLSLPRHPAIELAVQHRIPLVAPNRNLAKEGALISYGLNSTDMYHRAAFYVDRILKGTKPADLPVEMATKYDLLINLKTAQALGVTVPSTLLARADEVIE